jgi:transducin (beta)-like 1
MDADWTGTRASSIHMGTLHHHSLYYNTCAICRVHLLLTLAKSHASHLLILHAPSEHTTPHHRESLAMAHPGALSSDHINYLVLRYLQESGHENTAKAFYRDWNRPHEFRDPEDLPFTPTVQRYELVSVIQDGLAHDELQARVGRNERRFRWTMNMTAESMEEDGENGSRPSSSGKRKGRVPQPGGMRAPDEFPTPAAKRQRLSPGPEEVHVNGDRDAMDLDATSASPGDPEDDAEAASPEAPSEDATEAPAERYDSLDVATQTEVRRGPKTSTIAFIVSKPRAKVFHSSWSPRKDPTEPPTLLAVGEDLCRYYRVPNLEDGDMTTVEHVDQPSIPPDATITATAWHPNGRFATCAVDTLRGAEGEKQSPSDVLMDVGRDMGTVAYPSILPLLEPAGIVLCIRYSPSGEQLLVVRTNLKRGLVQVYETPTEEDKPTQRKELIAWRMFEHQVLDATWTNEESFVVCGDEGITRSYALRKPEAPMTNGFAPDSIALHHLAEQFLDIVPGNTKWNHLRHDAKRGLLVFASNEDRKLAAYLSPNSGAEEASVTVLEIPEQLTALALQPQGELFGDKGLVAACFEDGTAVLYEYSRSGALAFEQLTTLDLGHSPALALSWSPDGKHLALGGADTVRIWRVDNDDLGAFDPRPLVSWRQTAEADESDESEALSEPSLSWSPDGERLGFAVERQVCSPRVYFMYMVDQANVCLRLLSSFSARLFLGAITTIPS